ncbi:MAG: hypothetical protein R3F59_25690 [Myxococcota bacterium]
MTTTTRPRTHAERDACIAALDDLATTALAPLAAAAVTAFRPVAERYTAARSAHRAVSATRDEAAASTQRADAAFDRALRCWSVTVVDADGRPVRSDLAAMLGGVTPAQLAKLPYRQEVVRTGDLLVQLERRPSLSGDPARLADLIAAHRTLASETDALEAATRLERGAGTRLKLAVTQFDREWGKLVKALELTLGAPKQARGCCRPFVRPGKRRVAAPADAAAEPACTVDDEVPATDAETAAA